MPQSREESPVVHTGSEYRPRFGVTFIEPLVIRLLLTEMAP